MLMTLQCIFGYGIVDKKKYMIVLWIIGLRICDDKMMLDGWLE
jgi:hypothetical protein